MNISSYSPCRASPPPPAIACWGAASLASPPQGEDGMGVWKRISTSQGLFNGDGEKRPGHATHDVFCFHDTDLFKPLQELSTVHRHPYAYRCGGKGRVPAPPTWAGKAEVSARKLQSGEQRGGMDGASSSATLPRKYLIGNQHFVNQSFHHFIYDLQRSRSFKKHHMDSNLHISNVRPTKGHVGYRRCVVAFHGGKSRRGFPNAKNAGVEHNACALTKENTV
jgi:hypothetical protein